MSNVSTMIILVIITLAALLGLMMYYLDALNEVPEGKNVKLALAVATKYDLTNVRLSRAPRPEGEALLVRYETKALRSREQAKAEMAEVAEHAWKSMEAPERKGVAKIELYRECVRSAGCFKSRERDNAEWVPPPEPPK